MRASLLKKTKINRTIEDDDNNYPVDLKNLSYYRIKDGG
jgi:hypothetical protein